MLIKNPKLRNLFRPLYHFLSFRLTYILELIFPSRITDSKKIPIIINNFNRLTSIKLLIESLETRGYMNIFIIDNSSTYEPLLNFYNSCKYPVFRLKTNVGYLALWETDIYKQFINDYYVYTDSDVVPIKECPDDFMDLFLRTLKEYKFVRKVGFSLKIDNLPDFFEKKNEVIQWEKQFYTNRVNNLLYRAPIDTTFALYKPWQKGGSNSYVPMFRTAYPYEVEHLPWYLDKNNLSDEEKYYINNSKTSTMWTDLNK